MSGCVLDHSRQANLIRPSGLDPTFRGVYREVLHDVKVSQGTLKAKSRVFVDVSSANTSVRDSTFPFLARAILIFRIQSHVFTDPKEVNPSRGFDKYLVIDGAGSCVGLDLSSKVIVFLSHAARRSTQHSPRQMIAQMVRAVYSFKGAARAPGQSGTLKRYVMIFSFTSSSVHVFRFLPG